MGDEKWEKYGGWKRKEAKSGGYIYIEEEGNLKYHEIPGEKVEQEWGRSKMMNPKKENLVVVEYTNGKRIGSCITERVEINLKVKDEKTGELKDTRVPILLVKDSTKFEWYKIKLFVKNIFKKEPPV